MNFRGRIYGVWVLCLGIALLACGCAHKPLVRAPQKGATTLPTKGAGIVLDPTRIRAGEDPLTDLDGYDAEDLFQLGYDAFTNDDFELSALLYQRMVEECGRPWEERVAESDMRFAEANREQRERWIRRPQ